MENFRLENISVLAATPEQSDSFLCEDFLAFILGNCDRLNVEITVGGDDRLGHIDLLPWLREIVTVGDRLIKIMDGYPSMEFCGSGSTEVLEAYDESVERCLAVRGIYGDNLIDAVGRDNCPQLLASADVGVIGNFPLLVNKPIAYTGSDNQKKGESGNSARPFNQVAMGLICLAAAGWLSWRAIWHFVFSSRPRSWLVSLAVLALAAVITPWGLSLLFLWVSCR